MASAIALTPEEIKITILEDSEVSLAVAFVFSLVLGKLEIWLSRTTTTGVSHETWIECEFPAAIGLASSMSNNPDMPG